MFIGELEDATDETADELGEVEVGDVVLHADVGGCERQVSIQKT